jgi:hypothetical protein
MRDLATGKTRVALLWPLTRRPFSIRYRTYVGVLALLAVRAAKRRARPAPPDAQPAAPTAPAPEAPDASVDSPR